MSQNTEAAAVTPTPARRQRRWALPVVAVLIVLGLAAGWLRSSGPERSYRLGRAALIAGNRETVLREADSLIRTRGHEPRGWLLKGLFYAQSGKLNEAIVCLEKSAEDKSLAVEANTVAAKVFYSMGLYRQAIDAGNRAIQLDDNCLDARRWMASAYYDLGALENAIPELERISKDAPTDPRPTRLMGLIAKDGEDFVKAIEFYQESIRRDSQQPDAETILLELAECQQKLSRFDEALETLKQCQRSPAVLTLEATCHAGLGHFDDAHEKLRGALTLDAGHWQALLEQGKLMLDQGEVNSAVDVLKQAAQLQPHNSRVLFQYSQALRRTEKLEEADEVLKQMQQVQALEREFTDLHETAAQKPDDADVRFRIGELALLLDKPQLSRVWFRAALALDPRHVKAQAAMNRSK